MELLFSVFTPTYNRANTIGRVYEYLCKQTFCDFEWIVVDDGSTDETEEIVRQWIEENRLCIVYIKQANGGKHRAFNRAVQIAKGKIFICWDSDDYYKENALSIIASYYEEIKGNTEIAGFSCLSGYQNGNVIGTQLPGNRFISSHYELYYRYRVKGDKGLIYFTKILQKYPFPEFENEKFVTEALVLNRISRQYKLYCINQILEIKEYQTIGLSSKYAQLCLNSPLGYALYLNELNYFKLSFLRYIHYTACYVKYCLLAKKNLKTIYREAINRRWSFWVGGLLGLLLYYRDRNKR